MLSNTAEYALRAMVHLAREGDGIAVLGRDLAESSRVPANYLSKILVNLKKGGFVTAVRGAGGGYRLGKPAGKIYLIEIVELFDHERAHPRCLLDFDQECSDHEACTAHERWKSVRAAYVDFLRATSLDEIARSEESAESPAKKKRGGK
jgi:Rrf2 family iron-sulfur cluster assembly transcriptional regulator